MKRTHEEHRSLLAILKRTVLFWLFPLLLVGTGVVWWAWPFLLSARYAWLPWDKQSVQTFGQFGDTYGALSAVFAGFAFIAATMTLVQQHRAHDQSRKRDAAGRLVARWHELLGSRNELFKYVTKTRSPGATIPIYPDYFGDGVAKAVIDMMNFFEEWGRLEESKSIDSKYMATALGSHANWFYRNLFRDLSIQVRRRWRAGRKNELVEPLAVCWRFVFKRFARNDEGCAEGAVNALDEIGNADPPPEASAGVAPDDQPRSSR